MKVRWTAGSVRFRITPDELRRLAAGEPIGEALALPGGEWRVLVAPGSAQTDIEYAGDTLRLTLSAGDCARLAAPDAEGVYFRREHEPKLRYFVEKDFPCVHPRPGEVRGPESETFAPPAGFAERHHV